MKNKKVAIAMWVLALLPVAAVALLYSRLPDRIPMHWGVDGTVRHDPKASLWIMVLLGPLLALLLPFLRKIDPRGKNHERFMGAYEGLMVVVMLFLLVMNGVVLSESLHPGRISVSTVVVLGVGLLFVFLGNMMPKVKSNFHIGVKTPWTLSDPGVWNRANRLGGYCFFFGGLLLLPLPFLLSERILMIAMMLVVFIVCLTPIVMSYLWFRRRDEA